MCALELLNTREPQRLLLPVIPSASMTGPPLCGRTAVIPVSLHMYQPRRVGRAPLRRRHLPFWVSLVEESCVEMKKDSLVLRWKMRLEGMLGQPL